MQKRSVEDVWLFQKRTDLDGISMINKEIIGSPLSILRDETNAKCIVQLFQAGGRNYLPRVRESLCGEPDRQRRVCTRSCTQVWQGPSKDGPYKVWGGYICQKAVAEIEKELWHGYLPKCGFEDQADHVCEQCAAFTYARLNIYRCGEPVAYMKRTKDGVSCSKTVTQFEEWIHDKNNVTHSFAAHILMGFTTKYDGNEVIAVNPDGPAAKLGVKEGWRMVQLNGKPIPDNIKNAEFLDMIEKANKSGEPLNVTFYTKDNIKDVLLKQKDILQIVDEFYKRYYATTNDVKASLIGGARRKGGHVTNITNKFNAMKTNGD